MIRSLHGTCIHMTDSTLVLETGGIGYEVTVPKTDLFLKTVGTDYRMWIAHVVREDSEELIGFSEFEDVAFFELLCTVSGIGPKTAVGILDRSPRATLARAIKRGDPETLSVLGGVGAKVAAKIILALKEKVDSDDAGSDQDRHIIEALEGLGFERRRITDILPELSRESSLEDNMKDAIKRLSKQSS
jgi:holliday junction DNA helicase RuvA